MKRIAKLVIVGGGTAGWMSAALLGRTFGRTLDITLVESDDIATVGVGEATIPPILVYNQALGIDEAEFLRETRGTIKLGIEFENWGHLGHRYMHAFGDVGHYQGLSPFVHYYLRARAAGLADSLGEYSLGERAARAGRFGHLPRIPNTPLAGLNYAFHFDAGLYARYLRRIAEGHGVKRQEGRIVSVERDGGTGHVTSVTLADGTQVEGELFLDCSGFRALLIGDALGVGYQDWTHWLPADRAWAVPTENVGEPRPYTQSIAHQAGWQWRIPLQHRTGNGHVFSSAFTSEEEARDVLLANLEGKPIAEPRLIKFTTGRRDTFWEKNVVAIGLSSGFLEPLESTSIHLIQSGIQKLLALFPDRDFGALERDEYNRQMREVFEDVRDFIILHYKASRREDSAFWRYCRDMEVPATLQSKLALWGAKGRLFREGRELFGTPSWVAVLLGQGFPTSAVEPIAGAPEAAWVDDVLSKMHASYAHFAAHMPTHGEYVRANCDAAGLATAAQ